MVESIRGSDRPPGRSINPWLKLGPGQPALDASMIGVVVNHVVVTNAGVPSGAQRWTSGDRGFDRRRPFGAGANLEFATEVVKIGGHVLSTVGQTSGTAQLAPQTRPS